MDLRRPLVLGITIFLMLVAVNGLVDHRGALGSDTGGKVATLEAMTERGDWSVDVGYWAAEADPDGSLAPYFSTSHWGDNWVQVTTLPMILVSRPLYAAGGTRLALLGPMLGVVMTALGAGALHRRLGDSTGAGVTLLVGLAGPVFLYGLDFWEHSVGAALMVWGVVFLNRGLDPRVSERMSIDLMASGALFGLAATMRQEAMIYGLVAGLVVLWEYRRSPGRAVVGGAFLALGAALPLGGNLYLETRLMGEAQRAQRASGVISADRGGLSDHLYNTMLEVAGPVGARGLVFVLIAASIAIGLATLGRSVAMGSSNRVPLALVGVGYGLTALIFAAYGLGFVPGMLVVAPFAGATLMTPSDSDAGRRMKVVALGAVPLIAYFQYSGGVTAQWGGRLLLPTAVVLTVLGYDLTQRRDQGIWRLLVTISVAMSLMGTVWVVQRTKAFGAAMAEVAAAEPPVLVFRDPMFAREAGPLVIGERWLSATTEDQRAESALVLEQMGVDAFVYVVDEGRDPVGFPGFMPVSEREVPILSDFSLSLVTYESR